MSFENLERRKIKVGICKRIRIVVDVVNTRSWASRLGIRVASPISAECQIDNNELRGEMAIDVALGVREVGSWHSPIIGIDHISARLDVEGDGTTPRPEPDFDMGA